MSVLPAQRPAGRGPCRRRGVALPAPALGVRVVGGAPAPGPCGQLSGRLPWRPGCAWLVAAWGRGPPLAQVVVRPPVPPSFRDPSHQVSKRPGCGSRTRGLGCEGPASRGQRGSPLPSWGRSCRVGVRPGRRSQAVADCGAEAGGSRQGHVAAGVRGSAPGGSGPSDGPTPLSPSSAPLQPRPQDPRL